MSTPELTTASMLSSSPPKNNKIVVCKPLCKVGVFEIKYVQPDPLPNYIEYLQAARAEGIQFEKIPVSEKEDRLYLAKPIRQLLNQAGVHYDYIDTLIKRYNNSAVDPVEKAKTRTTLLSLVVVARAYAETKNIEFLVE